MSDFIEIRGIAGFGFHGLFEHERVNGQQFSVDLKIELYNNAASMSDDINDAVDYSKVIRVVHQLIVGEPVNLIERLAELIAREILKTFEALSVEVTVHKANAPVGLPVEYIAIRILRSR